MSAEHRFNNGLRYRGDDHEMQRQLTPSYVLEPVRQALGGIELDPCTEPDNPCGAVRFFTADTDGAEEPWVADTIYVNPPYSKARERWVRRCIQAAETGSRVVLLMPSHTDTRLFHEAIKTASHVVFIKGRVKFGILRKNRRQEAASHPSCLIAWNLSDTSSLAHLGAVWCVMPPTVEKGAPWCPECGPTCPLHGTADQDAPTVCIKHGRFIPCRTDGEHRYTSNPYWVKSVRDYQESPIEELTWEPAWSDGESA